MKNLWRNWEITGSFLLVFFLVTLLSLAVLGLLIFSATPNLQDFSLPTGTLQNPESLNWDAVRELEGWGELLDEGGKVIKRYGEPALLTKAYKIQDLPAFTANEFGDFTRMAYDLPGSQTLVLLFPKHRVTNTLTIELSQLGSGRQRLTLIVLLWLIAYLLISLLLGRWLQRRVAKKLQTQHQEEQEARMQVFRGLTHDIKTPLAAMMAYTKALVDGLPPAEEVPEYLKTIYHQGEILNNRVSSLLTITALDADPNQIAFHELDLLSVTRSVLDDLERSQKFNGLRLERSPSLQQSFSVLSNESLWKRCIENVVSNAVQHNPEGVTVQVAWQAASQQLTIEDNGKGVPPEKLNLLTEPFVRGDESHTDSSLSGIGLYVTRKILDQLGWELNLQNRTEGGLRLSFTYRNPPPKTAQPR